MSHKPDVWKLVVPCTLAIEERQFVDALGDKHDVKVDVLDRAQLEPRLANHADLVDYFTRDQARAAAKDYGREQALLAGGLPDRHLTRGASASATACIGPRSSARQRRRPAPWS